MTPANQINSTDFKHNMIVSMPNYKLMAWKLIIWLLICTVLASMVNSIQPQKCINWSIVRNVFVELKMPIDLKITRFRWSRCSHNIFNNCLSGQKCNERKSPAACDKSDVAYRRYRSKRRHRREQYLFISFFFFCISFVHLLRRHMR